MAQLLEADKRISHYRIISKIGAGGMGEIYLAEDTRLRRSVALKVLPESVSYDFDRLLRFEREARAASALNHPNILTIYEFGEEYGMHFLTTEYVKGKTLREMINDGGIGVAAAIDIGIQTASALEAAHAAGIIHRDIKPENIMLRDDGLLKVLDFGLAKLTERASAALGHSEAGDSTELQNWTDPGTVMGTAAYMSPEQARGKLVDDRTDIFSLGVVLYELLVGRRPFDGETSSHTLVSILEHDPPPMPANVPAELERIVLRALEKDVIDRYQSASEISGELRALKRRLENGEAPASAPPSRTDTEIPTRTFAVARSQKTSTGNTIAVLPFLNMSRGEEGDYFSDGLAEEFINLLSKIRGLRVAARTSAFSFKGKQTTIAEIGRVLNVSTVLEGSIRMAGDRVRISVQLIKVSDGYQLWSESYNRTMDDIFAVQDDIARSVVKELRERFLNETWDAVASENLRSEVADATRGRADDPEAQRLMLLGRYFLDRSTSDDTEKAIAYLREALDIDPSFALCWAELGRAYSIQAGRAWIDVAKGYELSRSAADKSLELEPELAEGYAQLGRIQAAHDWDFDGARRSYGRAISLAPGSSAVLDGAGVLAYKLGRFEEAIDLSRRVLVRDPLSAGVWHNLGLACHAAGRLAEAEKALRRALELVPQRVVTSALLALVLFDQGRQDEALKQAEMEPDEFWRTWAQAILHYAGGNTREGDALLDILTEDFSIGSAYQIAEVQAVRGDVNAALAWLGRAADERDPGVTHAKVNPRFARLHADPRWQELLTRIGF